MRTKYNTLSDTPTISVIMITYNHENFIKQAIEGVLLQNCNCIVELIIANDKSPDKTDEVIKSIINSHRNASWIKYTCHSRNKGMMANFIWSLNQAKGKYVAICEGDDYWTDPLKLQKQVDFLENNLKYSFCYHPWQNLFENNDNSLITNKIGDVSHSSRLLTLMIRNVIREFPKQFFQAPNADTFLRFMLHQIGESCLIKDINPGVRRIHDNGVMGPLAEYAKLPRRILTHEKILEAFPIQARNQGINDKINLFRLKLNLLDFKRSKGRTKLRNLSRFLKNGFLLNNFKSFAKLIIGKD